MDESEYQFENTFEDPAAYNSNVEAQALKTEASKQLADKMRPLFQQMPKDMIAAHGKDLLAEAENDSNNASASNSGANTPATSTSTAQAPAAAASTSKAAPTAPKKSGSKVSTTRVTKQEDFMIVSDEQRTRECNTLLTVRLGCLYGHRARRTSSTCSRTTRKSHHGHATRQPSSQKKGLKSLCSVRSYYRWTMALFALLELISHLNCVLTGGNITGKVTSVSAPTFFSQTWRAPTWPEGHYGTLKVSLEQGSNSTKLSLDLEGVPVGKEEETEKGLEIYYIRSLKVSRALHYTANNESRVHRYKRIADLIFILIE